MSTNFVIVKPVSSVVPVQMGQVSKVHFEPCPKKNPQTVINIQIINIQIIREAA